MSDDQTANPYASSPPPSFHPEFGYLCPSAIFWRRVRRDAKLVLAGMAIAAGAALGLSSLRPVAPPAHQDQRAVVAQVPQVPQESAPAPAPSTALAVTPSSPAAVARAQASCDDPSVSFLSPQCQSARKSHALRAAQERRRRLAAVPSGQGEAPVAIEPATAPPPTAAEAIAHQAPPAPDKPKKPVKTAHRHHRDNPDIDTAALAPPPPPPAFGLFGFFRDLPHY